VQIHIDDTVTEVISIHQPEILIQPKVIKEKTVYEITGDFWNKEKTDLDGVMQGNFNGNNECLRLQEQFLIDALKKSQRSELCLELAVGGPLQVFENILRKYMDVVDINEIARNHMY
jgi:hypothetical protein